MKRLMISVMISALMSVVLVGCDNPGVGNRSQNNTYTNVIVDSNNNVAYVLDGNGEWVPPEHAPMELLIDRGVVKLANGSYGIFQQRVAP